MAQKRSESEVIAYAALSTVYRRPPANKVTLAAEGVRSAMAEPWEMLAYIALRGHYSQPSAAKVAEAAQAIRASPHDGADAGASTSSALMTRVSPRSDEVSTRSARARMSRGQDSGLGGGQLSV